MTNPEDIVEKLRVPLIINGRQLSQWTELDAAAEIERLRAAFMMAENSPRKPRVMTPDYDPDNRRGDE